MTRIDIISGFLGAGKTTLIKKLLEEKVFSKDKLVIIENEYGEVGIDGALLKGFDIEVKEMNSGCICCTIAGDFSKALKDIVKRYHPDRIIIEPSGVGKLSDVIKGCKQFAKEKEVVLNICMTVIDAMKYKMYMQNFAEFYSDQLINAKTIILSRTQYMKQDTLDYVINDIKKHNKSAPIIITEWELLVGLDILKLAENAEDYLLENKVINELKSLDKAFDKAFKIGERRIIGSAQKKQHHADEVFSVWGKETSKVFDTSKLKEALSRLDKIDGLVLRAKGIVRADNNKWLQFDYVPGEVRMRESSTDFIGRICVIGEHTNALELSRLFGLPAEE